MSKIVLATLRPVLKTQVILTYGYDVYALSARRGARRLTAQLSMSQAEVKILGSTDGAFVSQGIFTPIECFTYTMHHSEPRAIRR
jgi:hypothetical protein